MPSFGIELALSLLPHSEPIGQLREAQRRAWDANKSARILKPIADSPRTLPTSTERRIMKNPLIGSVRSPGTTSRLSRTAGRLMRAPRVPIADVAARRVAAAHHDVGVASLQGVEHLRQEPLVVLHVGIDHREVVRRGRQHMPSTQAEASPAAADSAKTQRMRLSA